MHRLTFFGIIPAHYASSRFPGKPLADIKGKTMIRHVYERTSMAIDRVIVATDDVRIYDEVLGFGGKVVMTSDKHKSGTERCAEALSIVENQENNKFDVVINIQGDEPFLHPDHIELLKSCFEDDSTEIATIINPVHDAEILSNPNRVKVVVDAKGFALYFSRSVIPYVRNSDPGTWHLNHKYYQHIGTYAYRSNTLKKIVHLGESILEKAESLEQLRWLENGYRIKTAVTKHESYCIDTPEDLQKAVKKGL